MIAKFKVVPTPEKPEPYDREAARERVEVLTVREGSCQERWSSWGTYDDFRHYKDR